MCEYAEYEAASSEWMARVCESIVVARLLRTRTVSTRTALRVKYGVAESSAVVYYRVYYHFVRRLHVTTPRSICRRPRLEYTSLSFVCTSTVYHKLKLDAPLARHSTRSRAAHDYRKTECQ